MRARRNRGSGLRKEVATRARQVGGLVVTALGAVAVQVVWCAAHTSSVPLYRFRAANGSRRNSGYESLPG